MPIKKSRRKPTLKSRRKSRRGKVRVRMNDDDFVPATPLSPYEEQKSSYSPEFLFISYLEYLGVDLGLINEALSKKLYFTPGVMAALKEIILPISEERIDGPNRAKRLATKMLNDILEVERQSAMSRTTRRTRGMLQRTRRN